MLNQEIRYFNARYTDTCKNNFQCIIFPIYKMERDVLFRYFVISSKQKKMYYTAVI